MQNSNTILDLYKHVTTCARKCDGIVNDPKNGVIGRSFYYPRKTTEIEILLVSKNPAISDSRENAIYAPLEGEARVDAHMNFVRLKFQGKNELIKSHYHANIVSWVSKILEVPPDPDAVFSRVAMTALVKCHSFKSKTATLPESTKRSCTEVFFYSELNLLKPKFILALGKEVYDYLMRPSIREKHQLPVGKLHHPSWSNMKGGIKHYVTHELPKIREQYLRVIAA